MQCLTPPHTPGYPPSRASSIAHRLSQAWPSHLTARALATLKHPALQAHHLQQAAGRPNNLQLPARTLTATTHRTSPPRPSRAPPRATPPRSRLPRPVILAPQATPASKRRHRCRCHLRREKRRRTRWRIVEISSQRMDQRLRIRASLRRRRGEGRP